MEWSDKITVKKGDYGEKIVKEFLENRGYVVYKSITPKAHAFDILATKNKEKIIIVEVKTKASREYYRDTGIDLRSFNQYKKITEETNIDLKLVFVDEKIGLIYGNSLKTLEQYYHDNSKNIDYPLIHKNIIYFHLDKMVKIASIENSEIEILKNYSTRNYEYNIIN